MLRFGLIPLLLHALVSQAALTVTRIAGGNSANHSLFVTSDGSLWTMGENRYGQLGDGSFGNTNRPQRIVVGGVATVAGSGHSLLVKTDGSLWGMGWNYQGQLGDGTPVTSPPYGIDQPEPILAGNVMAVSAGGQHSLVLKSDGSLWAMGFNIAGQLGDGTFNQSARRPEQIVRNVVAIAAGFYHSLLVQTNGSLWAMGYNREGELGDGTTMARITPELIVPSNVTTVAAGQYHSLFIKSNGSLWAMGYNNVGQLGDGTTNNAHVPEQIVASNVVAVAAGYDHSLFLKADGSAWGMGFNFDGELGDGAGGVFGSYANQPEQIVSSNVVAIAAGSGYSLFLKSDGSVWATGIINAGWMGDGITTTAHTNRLEQIIAGDVVAIAAGQYHNLFLKSDSSLWGVGWNIAGQLGDGTVDGTKKLVQIVSSNVVAIAGGGEHSLFAKSDGSLWAMGWNDHGQLGDGFDSDSWVPEQVFPVPQPVLTTSLSSGTDLQINATALFAGNFSLLGSPDLGPPLQWTPVWTGFVDVRGPNNISVTLTNAVNPDGRQFYLLQSQ